MQEALSKLFLTIYGNTQDEIMDLWSWMTQWKHKNLNKIIYYMSNAVFWEKVYFLSKVNIENADNDTNYFF